MRETKGRREDQQMTASVRASAHCHYTDREHMISGLAGEGECGE